jgi:hypothetical protein
VRKLRILLAALVIVAALASVIGLFLARKAAQYQVKLADGSTFTLKQVTLTATNLSYSHQSRGRFWQLLTPIIPTFILQKIPSNGGGLGFGSDGSTNLIIITDLLRDPSSRTGGSIGRLRISDGTNKFDACWGASTLGYNNETVNGWQIRAFPRRGRDLILEFLSHDDYSPNWNMAAQFKISNPAAGDFPQWEPGPLVQTNEDLKVHLVTFRSGAPAGSAGSARAGSNPVTAARKTEMLFAFEQDGRPTEDWRVQKVILSDAAGNKWFPYLDLEKKGLSWAKDGRVEFLGALWPGENAWQLDVELSPIGGLQAEDMFSFETALPAPSTIIALTNEWSHGGTTVKFIGLASPNTEHSGDLKWTGKWWGDEPEKVYSLVLTAKPGLQKQRLRLVSALDQTGADVKFLEHRRWDYSDQALFFKETSDHAIEKVRLTFSLTSSKFVQFRARPDFVGP